MDPKKMMPMRRGMMPLDDEGTVTVSPPVIRPEMQAAADRRFREELGELPNLGRSPPASREQMQSIMRRRMESRQPQPSRFPPMDMKGAPPPPPPFRVGPPNPNPDMVPPGALKGWVETAQAEPSSEELLMLMQLGLA